MWLGNFLHLMLDCNNLLRIFQEDREFLLIDFCCHESNLNLTKHLLGNRFAKNIEYSLKTTLQNEDNIQNHFFSVSEISSFLSSSSI